MCSPDYWGILEFLITFSPTNCQPVSAFVSQTVSLCVWGLTKTLMPSLLVAWRITKVVAFSFLPKNLDRWFGPRILFCHLLLQVE